MYQYLVINGNESELAKNDEQVKEIVKQYVLGGSDVDSIEIYSLEQVAFEVAYTNIEIKLGDDVSE